MNGSGIPVIDNYNSNPENGIKLMEAFLKKARYKVSKGTKVKKIDDHWFKIIDEDGEEVNIKLNGNIITADNTNEVGLTEATEYTFFSALSVLKFNGNHIETLSEITKEEGRDNDDIPFFRVGDTYYKTIYTPNAWGVKEKRMKRLSRQTIIDDYGKSFLINIPKYDDFCNVPDYFNYKEVINNHYNLFTPFQHKVEEGEWPTINKLIKHIFEEQYEMGLDYMQLLLKKPLEILPILSLVSRENNTGKTTFVDFLHYWLKDNVAIIGTKDIEGDFNSHWASKHVIAVDESDLNKQKTTDIIKMISTSKSIFRKAKFENESSISFYGKIILLSNKELNYIGMTDEDIRFWTRKVKPLDSFDPDFLNKCREEVPAFTHFILNREMANKVSVGRAWFKDEDLNTQWTKAVKEYSKTELYHDLHEQFLEWFSSTDSEELIARPKDILEKWYKRKSSYSTKYISKVLTEEFKITPINKTKLKTNIDDDLKNEQYTPASKFTYGTFYIIKRDKILGNEYRS